MQVKNEVRRKIIKNLLSKIYWNNNNKGIYKHK